MGSKLMIKGKRSKRQRFASTMAMAAPSSSSSTSSGGTYTTCSNNNKYSGGLTSSTSMMSTPPPHESNISVPTNSVELQFTKSTQVEQDMANCLILLAQGQKLLARDQKTQAITMQGLYNYNVFRCKTCERAFPSFQALGGHRASHKRPKPAPAVQKVMVVPMDGEQHHKLSQFSTCTTTTLSLQISSCNNKSSSSSRVHECSICGSEFASGQALGGHMRRHRSTLVLPPPPIYDHAYSKKQPTNILSLDLNVLPPLEDESEFPFPLKEQVIVLSPSALVN